MPGLSGLSNHCVERRRRLPCLLCLSCPAVPPLSFIPSVLAVRRLDMRLLTALCGQSLSKSTKASTRLQARAEPCYCDAASAPVAQLDRVSVFETEGWEFKPLRARQLHRRV